MKNIFRVILFFVILFAVQTANAMSFNVVVLPADLLNVCDNYYCYPEVSEMIAGDLISYFNLTGKVNSPTINEVRRRLAANPSARAPLQSALNKYRGTSQINFAAYKQVANLFDAKSVLLVSNTVPVENAYLKRNVWEMLELSTALDFSYPYFMETDVVLLDLVNGLVMWSGNYSKKISDSNDNFSAPKASQSYSIYGYIHMYSKDILAKTIGENVILRFFPKSVEPVVNPKDVKPTGEILRYESNMPILNKKQRIQREELDPDKEQFGEVIFGL